MFLLKTKRKHFSNKLRLLSLAAERVAEQVASVSAGRWSGSGGTAGGTWRRATGHAGRSTARGTTHAWRRSTVLGRRAARAAHARGRSAVLRRRATHARGRTTVLRRRAAHVLGRRSAVRVHHLVLLRRLARGSALLRRSILLLSLHGIFSELFGKLSIINGSGSDTKTKKS